MFTGWTEVTELHAHQPVILCMKIPMSMIRYTWYNQRKYSVELNMNGNSRSSNRMASVNIELHTHRLTGFLFKLDHSVKPTNWRGRT